MQRAQVIAREYRFLRGLGLGLGAVDAGRGDGIEHGIHGLDASQATLEQLHRRDRFPPDELAQLHGTQIAQLRHVDLLQLRPSSASITASAN